MPYLGLDCVVHLFSCINYNCERGGNDATKLITKTKNKGNKK